MRLFCPLDLKRSGDETIYGWHICNGAIVESAASTRDLFIIGSKPARGVPGVPAPKLLGRIAAKPASGQKGASIVLHKLCCSLELESFPMNDAVFSPIIIYYKCNRALALNSPNGCLNSAPLQWVRWASMLRYQYQREEPAKNRPIQSTKAPIPGKIPCSALAIQSARLLKRLRNLKSVPLLVIDVLLGMAVGSEVLVRLESSSKLFSSVLKFCAIEFFEEYLDWFMGWPAGFKLNSMLTKFCGTFFLSLIQLWKEHFGSFLEADGKRLEMLLVLRFLGLSFLMCGLLDIWLLCTFHIRIIYRLATRLYRFYLQTLLSLFLLFQQRRWNPLKSRYDRMEVHMEQLLVASALFSVLFCTWPTIIAYYGLMVWAVVVMRVTSAVLESGIYCLNEFPMLRLWRILCGSPDAAMIQGVALEREEGSAPPTFVLTLKSEGLGMLLQSLGRGIWKSWASVLRFGFISDILLGKDIYL